MRKVFLLYTESEARMEIRHTEHDVQHQVTKCMFEHKHWNKETDSGAGAALAPREPAVTAPKEPDPQNLWQQWQQFMRRGLRFGKGLFRTGDREGTSVQTPVTTGEAAAAAAGDKRRSQEVHNDLIRRGLLCAQQLAAPVRSLSVKTVGWVREKIRKVGKAGKGMHSRYFGRDKTNEKQFGKFSHFSPREHKEQFDKQAGQKQKDEADLTCGAAFSQDFLLDSYNKSGEYTKLMK